MRGKMRSAARRGTSARRVTTWASRRARRRASRSSRVVVIAWLAGTQMMAAAPSHRMRTISPHPLLDAGSTPMTSTIELCAVSLT